MGGEIEGVSVPGILELIKTGGSAAIVGLFIVAVNVAKHFLKALRDIVETMNKQHQENKQDLESIKRAIVASEPEKARFFEAQR